MKNIKNTLSHPGAISRHTLQIIMGGTASAPVSATVLHGRWDGEYSNDSTPPAKLGIS